jgi:hypothetical protein
VTGRRSPAARGCCPPRSTPTRRERRAQPCRRTSPPPSRGSGGRWGIYGDDEHRVAFFGGRDDTAIVGLTGSPQHVMGEGGEASLMGAMSSFGYYTYEVLAKYLELPETVNSSGAPIAQTLTAAEAFASKQYGGVEYKMEFLAKTLVFASEEQRVEGFMLGYFPGGRSRTAATSRDASSRRSSRRCGIPTPAEKALDRSRGFARRSRSPGSVQEGGAHGVDTRASGPRRRRTAPPRRRACWKR